MSQNNAIPSEESLMEFGEVYMRAIALAWRDDDFKKMLLEDAMYALEHYFGYRSTWNFRFSVHEPDQMIKKYEKEPPTEVQTWGWLPKEDCKKDGVNYGIGRRHWVLPKNGMSFGLPTAPDAVKDFPVALALYNDAGPMYLFSCC